MLECDDSGGVPDCGEFKLFGRVWWDLHIWRRESREIVPGGTGVALIKQRCRECGKQREYYGADEGLW